MILFLLLMNKMNMYYISQLTNIIYYINLFVIKYGQILKIDVRYVTFEYISNIICLIRLLD